MLLGVNGKTAWCYIINLVVHLTPMEQFCTRRQWFLHLLSNQAWAAVELAAQGSRGSGKGC